MPLTKRKKWYQIDGIHYLMDEFCYPDTKVVIINHKGRWVIKIINCEKNIEVIHDESFRNLDYARTAGYYISYNIDLLQKVGVC